MALPKRYANQQATAKHRHRLNASARHQRQQQHAQRALTARHQALHDLGLPDPLVVAIEGRLKAQKPLLANVFGRMCPPLFGCTSAYELTRGRGWDTNLPSRLLGAMPKCSWLNRLRQRGQAILVPRWRHIASRRAAPQSRWPWRWGGDAPVFRKYGQDFERGGRWSRGQHKRVGSGIDGVLRVVVIGEGQLIVPVALAGSRPAPHGLGARRSTKRHWAQALLAQSLERLARRGLRLPRPLTVADRWLSDSKRMRQVRDAPQGVLLVQGTSSYAFPLQGGRKIKGRDLRKDDFWPWRQRRDAPGGRSARRRAPSAP